MLVQETEIIKGFFRFQTLVACVMIDLFDSPQAHPLISIGEATPPLYHTSQVHIIELIVLPFIHPAFSMVMAHSYADNI